MGQALSFDAQECLAGGDGGCLAQRNRMEKQSASPAGARDAWVATRHAQKLRWSQRVSPDAALQGSKDGKRRGVAQVSSDQSQDTSCLRDHDPTSSAFFGSSRSTLSIDTSHEHRGQRRETSQQPLELPSRPSLASAQWHNLSARSAPSDEEFQFAPRQCISAMLPSSPSAMYEDNGLFGSETTAYALLESTRPVTPPHNFPQPISVPHGSGSTESRKEDGSVSKELSGKGSGSMPFGDRKPLGDVSNTRGLWGSGIRKPFAVDEEMSRKKGTGRDGAQCSSFQTTITLCNVSQSEWNETRQRVVCEAVAVTAGLSPSNITVLATRDKLGVEGGGLGPELWTDGVMSQTGKRLLAIALEVTLEIECTSPQDLALVRHKLSHHQDLRDNLVQACGLDLQVRPVVGFRRGEEVTESAETACISDPSTSAAPRPYRNGYNLRNRLSQVGLEPNSPQSQLDRLRGPGPRSKMGGWRGSPIGVYSQEDGDQLKQMLL